jgi:uncharacterized Ntn-hydrolase superfamily protein
MTFSVVARCAATGRLGVATASASLAVGGRCPHARDGVGAVTTQNRTDPGLGPRVLDGLARGMAAEAALAEVMAQAQAAEWRQVAVIDRAGDVATYHGARCSGVFGEARGEGVVALGNLLASAVVPQAMVAGFLGAGDRALEERLLAALEAGLAAGGEVKPLRSAALVVVGEPHPGSNLRVDCAEAPLAALGALWRAWAPEMAQCRLWAVDPGALPPAT